MSIKVNGNQLPDNSVQKAKQDASVKQNKSTTTSDQAKGSATTLEPEVILDLGNSDNVSGNYQKPSTPRSEIRSIEALRKQAEETLAPLRQMVESLLEQQGIHYENSGLHIGQLKNRLEGKETGNDKAIENSDEQQMVEITPEMQAEAAKQIGEGGAFSPEVLSDTLVEFARSVSGDDKSKFELLKNSILEGFDAAEKAWGDKLPDISQKTKELTMKKLEDWSKSE